MKEPIAYELSKRQKEISVAEFFERNKHLLGFDSPTRALVTCVKEAVDNSLDACEEASILPDIRVKIQNSGKRDEFEITVEDNGPGVEKRQIPPIFGKLLYGSRFYSILQSRGQQGIGISACVLYAQLTTGKAAQIESKIGEGYPAHFCEVNIDTKKNLPEITKEELRHWEKPHGTKIRLTIAGRYTRGRQSALEYLRDASMINPHAAILFEDPEGKQHKFERITQQLPKEPIEIKPHPYGVEIGRVIKIAKSTSCKQLKSFLKEEFSSVGEHTANQLLKATGLPNNFDPKKLRYKEGERLIDAFKKVKIMPPPTNCLSPIGEESIKRSLKNEMQTISPEFIKAATRPPLVWSGNPFQVEAGLVYGGKLPGDEQVRVLRFANRVPLLYQQGGCTMTQAVAETDWQRYGLQQPGKRGVPTGPAIIMLHVASTNVPFTSESKEAIAPIPELIQEMKLALQECGRYLNRYLKKREKRAKAQEKLDLITQILPEIAKKSSALVQKPVPNIDRIITQIMNVVYIDGKVSHEQKGVGVATICGIKIQNWMQADKSFSVYTIIPKHAKLFSANPKPTWTAPEWMGWKLDRLPSAKSTEITFELRGLEKYDFDESEIYIKGIDLVHVVGAEKWEGGH
ncbi:MAG TPA: DNA topoisomerase VI subunit B [Thermoplasmata archaeon]|nr:DNA topoisomerase VI subunit B [Thermoplasmata archaeon]